MRYNKGLGLAMLLIVAAVGGGSVAKCQEPSKAPSPAPADSAPEMSEAKQKAIARASVVPTQMRFDLSKYISVPVDKNEPPGVLNDSTIKQFVVPVALDADWWIVLFLPENPELGPRICVYLDKRLDVVRGYIIGPPLRAKAANPPPEKANDGQ